MRQSRKSSLPGLALASALAAMVFAPTAAAAPLTVSSYSMNNGAHGSYNYRDFTYSNCAGVCDTNNAPFSGGTGKLTDGILPDLSWYQYGEATPWVGWTSGLGQLDPTVVFYFASTVYIDSVTVWVDNSLGYGGVWHPDWVAVGGDVFALPYDDLDPSPRSYTFDVDITASSVTLQFSQTANRPWLMVGEVSFDDGNVPEPASLSLLGLALAAAGFSRRRPRCRNTKA